MSRWKAAAIHLSLSALVALILLALLFGLWYPQPYFHASGGAHLAIVLLLVDLVLGPLLTLVVFKSGKKSLRFDLAVIAALQASALIYGLHVITEARPIFIVGAIDRFNVVAANEVENDDLAKGSSPFFQTRSWSGPRLVAASPIKNGDPRTDPLTALTTGKDIQNYPELYVDYAEQREALLARAKPLSALRKTHPEAGVVLDKWLDSHKRDETELVWLPVLARTTGLTMLIEAKTGMPIEALAIDPW